MQTNLFKKAAVFSDLHAGAKSNSISFNEDCIKFVEWFIETAHNNNCDICLFLGDFFNNRTSTNNLTGDYGLRCMRLLSDAFDRVILLIGNHDSYFKDNISVTSLNWASHLPNIEIVNEIKSEGNVTFAPWLVGNDHKKLLKTTGKYLFGHFELPNFLMNGLVRMPDVGELTRDQLHVYDHVFSGHFHKRQTQDNITYIGNAFPHNYGDAWDDERGMMILPWGEQPQFISWPGAPKYKVLNLSQLVNDPEKYLEANSYIRVKLDLDITYEEASYIKENLSKSYKLREMALISSRDSNHTEDLAPGDITFESVDQIIHQQLTNINSEFYDNQLLLDIYKNL